MPVQYVTTHSFSKKVFAFIGVGTTPTLCRISHGRYGRKSISGKLQPTFPFDMPDYQVLPLTYGESNEPVLYFIVVFLESFGDGTRQAFNGLLKHTPPFSHPPHFERFSVQLSADM